MNEWVLILGIESWKPVLSALLLPPVPLLLLMLVGAAQMWRRPVLGWLLVLLATVALWLGSTTAVAEALRRGPLAAPPALTAADIAGLRRRPGAPADTAIVVLGGGRDTWAPELAGPNLTAFSLERLRYGIRLARETGQPLAFSGGVGHGQTGTPSEAEVAAEIAAREFARPLQWTEKRSRDTRENALYTLALLRPLGITRIVVVTHGWHMRRALRDFERAAALKGGELRLVAAPMGLATLDGGRLLRWLPSAEGALHCRLALHEWLGLALGA